jgi:hypothetical protein
MGKDIKVSRITPSGIIIKSTTNSGRPGFAMDVTLHLEDGSEHKHRACTERKKDLPRSVERMQESAAAGCMAAMFNDAGEFWCVRQSFAIGSSGLAYRSSADLASAT